MLESIVRFTDDSAGLEKTLRLFQGLCTIAVSLAVTAIDADFWAKTRGQFALGRRYFRLLKWYPAFVKARKAAAVRDERPSSMLTTILDTFKHSFLSLYFFLEMLTITNAMGVTAFDWGARVQREANRCWFYSLAASILLSCVDLHLLGADPITTNQEEGDEKASKTAGADVEKEKKKKEEEEVKQDRSTIYMQLVIDGCDLLLPGSALEWTPTPLASPLVVGIATTISTTVSGSQIWWRVQGSAQQS